MRNTITNQELLILKRNYTASILILSLMHKQALSAIISSFLAISFLSSCQTSDVIVTPNIAEKTTEMITIFTLDPLLAIHTKMITGDAEKVIL